MPEVKGIVRPSADAAGAGLINAEVASLQEEVRALSARHRLELDACLQRWAQGLQRQPVDSPAQQKLREAPSKESSSRCKPSTLDVEGSEKSREGSKEGSPSERPSEAGEASPVSADGAAVTLSSKTLTRKRKVRHKGTSSKLIHHTHIDITWLERVTTSMWFEAASAILIILNAIFIGVQSQHTAKAAASAAVAGVDVDVAMPLPFLILQVAFTVLFALELLPRWMRDGLIGFFTAYDRWWNIMDVAVVSFSIIDLFMRAAMVKNKFLSNFSIVRVLRVVRIVRIIRFIRVMKFFRELRMMVYSILRSMKALLWVVLVLGLLFYMFGILFTEATIAALDTGDKWVSADTLDLRNYFGTLDRSILSLFMAMSGGNDWSAYYTCLGFLPAQYSLIFLGYISFSIFAVVNIVTGVFVESALNSNNEDVLVTAQEELDAKKEYLEAMHDIFEEMDEDGSGEVSMDEFEFRLGDERAQGFFRAMKVDASDARKLFRLLDTNQSNTVDIEEFMSGCYRLQGESRMMDMKMMQLEVSALAESFAIFQQKLGDVHQSLLSSPRWVGGQGPVLDEERVMV